MAKPATYRKSIVSLIDILGFKRLVHEASEGPARVSRLLRRLRGTTLPRDVDRKLHGMVFTAFSDLVVRSTPLDRLASSEHTTMTLCLEMDLLRETQQKLLRERILVQGGITIGDMHHEQRSGVVFGPALIRAYELQSKDARHPRIVVDSGAVEFCKTNGRRLDDEDLEVLDEISPVDQDGVRFIDYLRLGGRRISVKNNEWRGLVRLLRYHKACILEYRQHAQANTFELSRCKWLEQYHNSYADRCAAQAQQSGLTKEAGALARLHIALAESEKRVLES